MKELQSEQPLLLAASQEAHSVVLLVYHTNGPAGSPRSKGKKVLSTVAGYPYKAKKQGTVIKP